MRIKARTFRLIEQRTDDRPLVGKRFVGARFGVDLATYRNGDASSAELPISDRRLGCPDAAIVPSVAFHEPCNEVRTLTFADLNAWLLSCNPHLL
jgi:hypothetical protein